MLSGARREKEAPDGLDIVDNRRDSENSDSTPGYSLESADGVVSYVVFAMRPFVDRMLFGWSFRLIWSGAQCGRNCLPRTRSTENLLERWNEPIGG